MQPPTDNPFTLINKPGPEENYIIGGPGCGKSRHLAELISGAGRGLNPIVISSNRTIAKEVAKLDPGFDQTRIGTIHSHCIRALGNPRLADDPEGILAWNEAHPRITLIPALDRDEIDLWERPVGTVHPGLLMNDYQRLRAARQPMPTDGPLADFARAWDSWRVSTRTLDSNDLLERCLEENIPAPGNSGCIFVDEAQDLTPLELALIRQWSSAGIPVVFAGDPNQNLYWWRGAESSALANLDDVPGTRTRILRQSHRVPRAIHRVTLDWMRECPTNPAIDYRPRDFAGGRWLSPSNWREPEQIIEAAEQLASGGSEVMILASNILFLKPAIEHLRRMVIPFHNPWRPTNARWNPNSKDSEQVTPAQRIQAFHGFDPSASNALLSASRWTSILSPAAAFANPRHGLEQLRHETANADHSSRAECLSRLISPQALAASASGDLVWLNTNLAADRTDDIRYVIRLAARHGIHILDQEPRITVGTIHSVKGAETDFVFVFPDLQLPDLREWLGPPESMAGIYRQFYVAMTRARRGLTICAPAGSMTVDLQALANASRTCEPGGF